jgi:hypothetical protein
MDSNGVRIMVDLLTLAHLHTSRATVPLQVHQIPVDILGEGLLCGITTSSQFTWNPMTTVCFYTNRFYEDSYLIMKLL